MLEYRFEKEENEEKIYIFFPEGNKDVPGRVAFGKDGTERVIEESDGDFKQMYAIHALRGIDKNKSEGIVAWY